jgi:hypothetical protein
MQRLADIARRAAVAMVRKGAGVHSMQQRIPPVAMQLPSVTARAPTTPSAAALQDEDGDVCDHLPLVRLASIEAAGTTVLTVTASGASQRLLQQKSTRHCC